MRLSSRSGSVAPIHGNMTARNHASNLHSDLQTASRQHVPTHPIATPSFSALCRKSFVYYFYPNPCVACQEAAINAPNLLTFLFVSTFIWWYVYWKILLEVRSRWCELICPHMQLMRPLPQFFYFSRRRSNFYPLFQLVQALWRHLERIYIMVEDFRKCPPGSVCLRSASLTEVWYAGAWIGINA